MILDGHIHIKKGQVDRDEFARRLAEAGVDGGILISYPPKAFPYLSDSAPPQERLDNVFAWAEAAENLHPFYWIDPTEPDALDQVHLARKQDVAGFKVICQRHFPSDPRAMEVFRAIAEAGRPILFHSGILYDGAANSRYNRPVEFEALLDVNGLRFSMAHLSWPWGDELIALYGQFQSARRMREDLSVELFIDTTPGTPKIYRRDAFTKLFKTGFDVEHNVFFGTDSMANDYSPDRAKAYVDMDNEIFRGLALDQATVENIYSGNLKRFLGLSKP